MARLGGSSLVFLLDCGAEFARFLADKTASFYVVRQSPLFHIFTKGTVVKGISVGGLTIFGFRDVTRSCYEKTLTTYTFSESLIKIAL